MANLTHRAEQALLGALLRDPDQMSTARFVTATDFASPEHRDVFNTIVDVVIDAATGQGNAYRQPTGLLLAVAAAEPELGYEQLRALSQACPRPAHAAAYAQMVLEASLSRQLAAGAVRFNQEIARSAGPGYNTENIPGHLRKLAEAAQEHVRLFNTDISAHPITPTASRLVPADSPGDWRARQEEDVLADLIGHFRPNGDVVNWLPADAFTPGPRRGIYQAIRTLAHNGEPVDELTVQWQLARNAALTQTAGAAARPRAEPRYVADLAAHPVADGTATLTGRLLLNHHANVVSRTAPAAAPSGRVPQNPQARPPAPSRRPPGPARPPSHPTTAPPPRPPRRPGPEPRA